MYKSENLILFIVILFAIIFVLLIDIFSGAYCNCKCMPYKPYTTVYKAYLA